MDRASSCHEHAFEGEQHAAGQVVRVLPHPWAGANLGARGEVVQTISIALAKARRG